jgi:hypothetical protein
MIHRLSDNSPSTAAAACHHHMVDPNGHGLLARLERTAQHLDQPRWHSRFNAELHKLFGDLLAPLSRLDQHPVARDQSMKKL